MSSLCLAIAAALLTAAPGFQVTATLKSVDPDGRHVVVEGGGQERHLSVPAEVKVLDAEGQEISEGLRSDKLKPGIRLALTVQRGPSGPVLQSIRLEGGATPDGSAGSPRGNRARPSAGATPLDPRRFDTTPLVPLSDMGPDDRYKGFAGGLYPDGSNQRPSAHEEAGRKLARQIRPLNAEGRPDAAGKIVLLTIGFSNTLQCSNGLIAAVKDDAAVAPQVVVVNGAHGGRSAFMIQKDDDHALGREYWTEHVAGQLAAAGVTAAQVEAVWLKETDARLHPGQLQALGVKDYPPPTTQAFPVAIKNLQAELTRIVQIIARRFPNVKTLYVSSRSYGGWAAPGAGNPEPFSYETGFAVKWLLEAQIKGDAELNFDPARGAVKAPWLSWGPYFWANGEKPRHDGYSYKFTDYRANDHMHHSEDGIRKMGHVLLDFFKTDSTTRGWFLAKP